MQFLSASPSCRRVVAALVGMVTLVACAQETVDGSGALLTPMRVDGWTRELVLQGTPILLDGAGFLVPALGEQRLIIHVDDGREAELPVTVTSDLSLRASIDAHFLTVFPAGTTVEGQAIVIRTLAETGASDRVVLPVSFAVVDNLDPTIISVTPATPDPAADASALYPGDELVVAGSGFLLAGEGETIIELRGTYETLVPPETLPISAVVPLNGASRTELRFMLTPDILGVRPGVFRGAITVTNEARLSSRPGIGLDGVERTLHPPRIDTVAPAVAARGQRITATGRGLLPTDSLYEATTLLRLEGSFTTLKTSQALILEGPTALALFSDEFEGNRAMRYVLRVTQTPAGGLEGLGLIAGDFDGTVSPIIISGAETILGQGIHLNLRVSLQEQIVFVKFLPGFTATLQEMGLDTREADIRARILAVCARDYQGVNIAFREARPQDFSEYSIIEVGGEDPNGQGLFGLDNTAGKDVGNVRFNDVIGGANADTAEQGYYAFGGVFVRSFFSLSPTLDFGGEAITIASPRFDDVFAPFMPGLGGLPLTAAASPARQALADEAVRVLGNLVGNTVVHEIGHSLGLTNIEGEYHNIGDNPGWIMDTGSFRPFEERAELDGQGPEFFAPFDREYLVRILPVQ